MIELSIVLPAYEEGENLEKLLPKLQEMAKRTGVEARDPGRGYGDAAGCDAGGVRAVRRAVCAASGRGDVRERGRDGNRAKPGTARAVHGRGWVAQPGIYRGALEVAGGL